MQTWKGRFSCSNILLYGLNSSIYQGNYLPKKKSLHLTLPRMLRCSVQVTCLPRGPRALKTPASHRHSYEHTKYSSVSALQQKSAHNSAVLSALCNRSLHKKYSLSALCNRSQHTIVQFCQGFATEVSTQNSTLTFPLLSYLGSSDCP